MLVYIRMAVVARLRDGRTLVNDFVGGGCIAPRRTRRMTDDDALAHALWLVRHGQSEEAEEFLEEYVQNRHGMMIRH